LFSLRAKEKAKKEKSGKLMANWLKKGEGKRKSMEEPTPPVKKKSV